MTRTAFEAETPDGPLAGWHAGEGAPVLAVHGGPGLGYDYLDTVVEELAGRFQVATFQQRGLAPSTLEGKFTIDEAVADLVAVLDALGWETAHLMGHSYGGHLVLHAAAAVPERIAGVLAVDPLGAVGDGGAAAFGAEMRRRVRTPEALARIDEIEAREEAGTATTEESLEGLSLFWPSYFPEPTSAPPMPPVDLSLPAHLGLWGDLVARLPDLESALPGITVPVGVVVGEGSPMPTTAGSDSADRIPGAWTHVEPGAGHFVWHEAPGSVTAAMERLARGA